MEYIHQIGELLGEQAELQAFLHLLMDIGLVSQYDYRKKRERKIQKSPQSCAKKK